MHNERDGNGKKSFKTNSTKLQQEVMWDKSIYNYN